MASIASPIGSRNFGLPLRVVTRLLSASSAFALAACAADASQVACPASTAQGLYGGERSSHHLQASEIRSAGLVTASGDDSVVPVCTGTLVAPNWVLSAKHCLQPYARIHFSLGETPLEGPESVREVLDVVRHPSLDLALLELEPGELDAPFVPFSNEAETQADIAVEVIGYGITETGSEGSRRFLSTTVSEIDDEFIWLDGEGLSGACFGDSGAPLFIIREGETPRLSGVLSVGSPDCVNLDGFTRVDKATSWLSSVIRASPAGCRAGGEAEAR